MAFLFDENGQGMVEYALVLGLITLASVAVLLFLGPKIKRTFSDANSSIDKATTEA